MIFNYCIYGEVIGGYSGDIECTFYDNTLTEILTKTYTIDTDINNIYQFNLGDSNLCTLNYILREGSSIVLTIDGVYFANIVLDINEYIIKHDIDLADTGIDTTTVATAPYETYRIVTDKIKIEELDTNLYSYFKVYQENIPEDIIYHEENGNELNWIPKESGAYKILQRAYNTSSNTLSEIIVDIIVLENYTEVQSIDYIFYTKKNKIIQIELPEYVSSTLMLLPDWRFENNKLIGKHDKLTALEMDYSRGKVIIKTQVGDIIDY